MKTFFAAALLLANLFAAPSAAPQRTEKRTLYAVRYVLIRFSNPKTVTYNQVVSAVRQLGKRLDLSKPDLAVRQIQGLMSRKPETLMSSATNMAPGTTLQTGKTIPLKDLRETLETTLKITLKGTPKQPILRVASEMRYPVGSASHVSEFPIHSSAPSIAHDYQYGGKGYTIYMVGLIQAVRL
jgi:hypothetical protein